MQISRPISRHANSSAAAVGLLALVTAAVVGMARPAQAQLTLTPAGTALNFSLSTFVRGFASDSNHVGPLGIAFPSSGGVLVTETFGAVRLFADTDGQNAATTPVGQNYGFANATGLAAIGSDIYMTQRGKQDVVQINSNGTLYQTIVGGLGVATGIVADPANGHLFVSNDTVNGTVFDVNPIAKTATPLVTGIDIDGASLSADDSTLYGADGQTGHIYGFNTSTGQQVFDSGYIPGGVDGTAPGFGNLAGSIFANTNSGTFVEINLATDAKTLIASGGSRGDFVTVDPTNNSLLLTQTGSILRLTPGTGGGFGPPVPEASTTVSFGLLLGLGLCGLTVQARRRKARADG